MNIGQSHRYLSVLRGHFWQQDVQVLVGKKPLILCEVVQTSHSFPQLVLDPNKSKKKNWTKINSSSALTNKIAV